MLPIVSGLALPSPAAELSLDQALAMALTGDQMQRFWTGSASMSITQDLLSPLHASTDRIALRQSNEQLALDRFRLDAARSALADARDTRLPMMDLTGSVGIASLSETAAEAVQSLWGPDGFQRLTIALDVALPLGGRAALDQVRTALQSQELAAAQLAKLRGRLLEVDDAG